ncbi:TlpA disulfide reductase family protein [Accumulibacter sp.]|uniref:TlpA disulfide reductase family protein n=1 Tax=Accumulibacter sp. TaxID=2053492 RepID=UPI002608E010|nr:TlpA disulfide reductase family protein [Accumulibacter sp.]
MKRLLAALLFTLQGASATADAPSADAFFALSLANLEQRLVPLASFRGKPLVVNFWARWCAPCRKEIPDLARLHARYKDRGVFVIGIAVEEVKEHEKVRDFARAYEMSYTSLIGGIEQSIELMRSLGNSKAGLPFTVVIDSDGQVRSSKLGAMSAAEMEAAVGSLLRTAD